MNQQTAICLEQFLANLTNIPQSEVMLDRFSINLRCIEQNGRTTLYAREYQVCVCSIVIKLQVLPCNSKDLRIASPCLKTDVPRSNAWPRLYLRVSLPSRPNHIAPICTVSNKILTLCLFKTTLKLNWFELILCICWRVNGKCYSSKLDFSRHLPANSVQPPHWEFQIHAPIAHPNSFCFKKKKLSRTGLGRTLSTWTMQHVQR